MHEFSDSILKCAPFHRLQSVSLSIFFSEPVPLGLDPLEVLLALQLLLNDVHLLDLVLAPMSLVDLLEVLLLKHAHLPLHHNLVLLFLPCRIHTLFIL